jgi:hypothetical protein
MAATASATMAELKSVRIKLQLIAMLKGYATGIPRLGATALNPELLSARLLPRCHWDSTAIIKSG